MFGWISQCVEGIPEKYVFFYKLYSICRVLDQESVTFYFISSFQRTILIISCKKGEATFKSDNISTISIIKDVITKEAISRKIRIDIQFGKKIISNFNPL